MNELIRELAGQARDHARRYVAECRHYGYYMEHNEYEVQFTEKFAELLIKRCGQVLVDNTPVVNLVEDWDKGYDRAMNDCIHHIYGHFGLEE